MYQILTYPRDGYDETALSKELIYKLIQKHTQERQRLKDLKKYYLGEHAILKHERRNKNAPNFKTVANHAKDIADTATGYFMGNAIKYNNTADGDIESLIVAFDGAEIDQVDTQNALNMSIYGRAYEYIYAKEGLTELDSTSVDPDNVFLVYDDSIERKVLFAVYYYEIKDDTKDATKYQAEVFTQNLHYHIVLRDSSTGTTQNEQVEPHNLGQVPIIEYRNNHFAIGDYEQQISLIDAYNSLMGNRVNDKEQAVESILVLYGAQLADNLEDAREAMSILAEEGLLELPTDAKADFLKNALDENATEILRKALKEDIYTFSHVPNLTDENFAGNSSGVAMEFKLLGLEMITKTKEANYKRGIRQRIAIFAHYLGMQQIALEAHSIVPQFSRGLPKNLLELSQVINNLEGKVSLRQLISLLPFVEDPDAELEDLEEEKEKNMERVPFFNQVNTKPDEEVTDEQQGLLDPEES
ncbi:phage portal protein, SPP1 family [Streptococcus infantis X]|uniref:Phage portal protein, SPP1 family n=1 Tax=Streptococcus infantis X TaxID=997830 RepID=F9PCF0_9STRE|nr:phage portal protein, SPP1 family [Streptococcus infantis X]QBX25621.1 portal protein [Streptococcus phage Javan266]